MITDEVGIHVNRCRQIFRASLCGKNSNHFFECRVQLSRSEQFLIFNCDCLVCASDSLDMYHAMEKVTLLLPFMLLFLFFRTKLNVMFAS